MTHPGRSLAVTFALLAALVLAVQQAKPTLPILTGSDKSMIQFETFQANVARDGPHDLIVFGNSVARQAVDVNHLAARLEAESGNPVLAYNFGSGGTPGGGLSHLVELAYGVDQPSVALLIATPLMVGAERWVTDERSRLLLDSPYGRAWSDPVAWRGALSRWLLDHVHLVGWRYALRDSMLGRRGVERETADYDRKRGFRNRKGRPEGNREEWRHTRNWSVVDVRNHVLVDTAERLRRRGARAVWLVQAPLHPERFEELASTGGLGHMQHVLRELGAATGSGVLIPPHNLGLGAEHFSDAVHTSYEGAQRYTEWLAGELARAGTGPAAASREAAPSVLLVTIDTLRADHVGAYGHPEATTPVLDDLARQGLVFERAVAASSRTAPSHASIMTSRWVRDHAIGHRNGSTRLRDETTLGERFSAAGWATAAFVSNTMLEARVGLDRGFDHYDDALPDRERNRAVFERTAEHTTDRALEWLARTSGPWLLWVHYNDPHGPYTAAMPDDARFEGAHLPGMPPDAGPLPALDAQRGWQGIPAYQRIDPLRRPEAYRAHYAAEVRHVDRALGRLLASARDAAPGGLVTLVTSDHGESMGEEGFYFSHGHATTPELAHVPLVLAAPGVAPGRSDALVHHVDVLPTLLELAGLEAQPDVAGRSLLTAGAASADPDRVVFCDVGAEVSAYRTEQVLRERLEGDLGHVREGEREPSAWPVRDPLPLEPELARTLESYAARLPDLAWAREPDAEEREQLRALGYAEPDGAPAPDTR